MNADDRKRFNEMAENVAVTRTKVESIEKGMEKGDLKFTALETRVGKLEGWRNRILGALAIFTGLGLWALKYLPSFKGGGAG